MRRLLSILLLFVTITTLLVSADERNTADDKPIPQVNRTAEMDARDLTLAKRIGNEFAVGINKVRETTDIHFFSNWLLPTVHFQICTYRLDRGQLQWYIAKSSIEKEKFPTSLQIEAVDAYTRGEYLSFVANATGFIFEDNDRIILDFKNQTDGSYKLSHGTILTCREEPTDMPK